MELFLLLKQTLGFCCCIVVIKNLLVPGLDLFISGLSPGVVEELDGLFNSETGVYKDLMDVVVMRTSMISVAMAIADVFSKSGYTIPNKNAKILKIFERLETLKRWWVISQR